MSVTLLSPVIITMRSISLTPDSLYNTQHMMKTFPYVDKNNTINTNTNNSNNINSINNKDNINNINNNNDNSNNDNKDNNNNNNNNNNNVLFFEINKLADYHDRFTDVVPGSNFINTNTPTEMNLESLRRVSLSIAIQVMINLSIYLSISIQIMISHIYLKYLSIFLSIYRLLVD
jgi:hypothetical protein